MTVPEVPPPDSPDARAPDRNRLAAAVIAGDLPECEGLLAAGADPNGKDAAGYPPLVRAAGLGHRQLVELLLAAGADPLLLDTRMAASALHRAAQGGHAEVLRLLLAAGIPVDLQSPTQGHTAIIDAVWNRRLAAAELLLDAGADPTIEATGGYDAHALARAEGLDQLTAALEAQRERREEADADPLRLAALSGDAAAARAALEAGADPDRVAFDGHTPLLDASREGHAEVVEVLLDAGADPRIVDKLMKATPAHKAGAMGHPEVARVLVADERLELDAQGPYNGYTALHDAIWHGSAETARVYVDAGARLDLVALDGRTVLDMAAQYGYAEIVELLEGHGAPATELSRRRV